MKLKQTYLDFARVLSGTAFAQGITFLTVVLLTRHLGPAKYGLFATLLAIFNFCVEFSDFGLKHSLPIIGSSLIDKKEKYESFLFSTFILKFFFTLIISACVWIFANELALFLFQTNAYTNIIKAIAVSLLAYLSFPIITTHFQSRQNFTSYSLIYILNASIRLLGVLVFVFWLNTHKPEQFIYIYCFSFIPIIAYFLFKARSISKQFDFKEVKRLFHLGIWILISSMAVLITMKLDLFMLKKLSTDQEIGFYAAGFQLSMFFPLITGSLTNTLLPKLDHYLKNHSPREFFLNILKKTKLIIIPLLVFELVAPTLVLTIFGKSYEASILIFRLFLFSSAFSVLVTPISLLFLQFKKAHYLAMLNLIQLTINFIGNLFLIPLFDSTGAAVATLISSLFGSIYILFFAWKLKS